VAVLRTFARIVTPAIRARLAATFEVPRRPDARDLGPVVIMLDDDLEVVGRTAASGPMLQTLLTPGPAQPLVPASVYNVAAQLLAVEHGIDRNAARSRTHLAAGVWVTLRAARLASQAVSVSDVGVLAVTIEQTTPDERVEVFALAYGLSPREREVLARLSSGRDTRRLARELRISAYRAGPPPLDLRQDRRTDTTGTGSSGNRPLRAAGIAEDRQWSGQPPPALARCRPRSSVIWRPATLGDPLMPQGRPCGQGPCSRNPASGPPAHRDVTSDRSRTVTAIMQVPVLEGTMSAGGAAGVGVPPAVMGRGALAKNRPRLPPTLRHDEGRAS
jgi:hypothetical protein